VSTRFGTIRGVLFDIDDTLVDLEYAMTTALREVSEHLLPGLDQTGWERFGRIFTHETTHYYDRYLAGELTFNDQRLLRGRAALGHFGVDLGDGEESHRWLSAYSRLQPSYVRAFADVLPLLDLLDAAGIQHPGIVARPAAPTRRTLTRNGADPARLRTVRREVGPGQRRAA